MEKYQDPNLSFQERAEDLADQMTFEEQAPQMRYEAPAVDRLGIPAFNWWSEGLHGVARSGTATMFPQAIALAAMFDDKLLGKVAKIIGTEARAKYNASSKKGDRDIYKGLTLWSPNINIFRDPRWGRGHETYGEDPYLTTKLGVSFVKGLQGDGKYMLAAGCAKHFAAHSGPEALRHEFNTIASKKDLAETYLPAFEALVKDAKVEGVMGAYTRLNGEPTCASSFLMGKLKEWGFDGYFVSDCWAIRDFHEAHHVTKTPSESAAMAVNAGCDLNCGHTYLYMMQAAGEGLVSKEAIRNAVVHLMRTRLRLGLFDKTELDDIPYDVVACDEHRKVSLECAEKSMVLLKNEGLLPLKKETIKSIAVIGPNSDSIDALRGNYYGTSAAPKTFLEGIREEVEGSGIRVYYAEGASLSQDRIQPLAQAGDGIAEAQIIVEMADVIVLCVGLDATLEGEQGDTGNAFDSGDKRDLLLPIGQRVLIEKVLALGKPTVVVLSAGSSINPLCEGADALIQAWYPGELGGTALANILFGKTSPSGKLPVTFYESIEGIPDFADYSMKNRTYRYTRDNILYPFGFGLSYGNVVVTDAVYDASASAVTVSVENQGDVATEDVVQIYIRSNTSSDATPFPKLCGFARVAIPAGGEENVTIPLEESAFSVVNDEGEVVSGGSDFTLFAGTSQPDELSQKLGAGPVVKVNIVK